MKKSGSKSGFWGAAVRAVAGAILLASVLFFLSTSVSAQVFDTGTVKGSVTDPSGAMVPNAKVTVTNTGTGLTRNLQTDANGLFVASALPYGTYVVEVTASGFGATKSDPIKLVVGAIVNVNLSLAVSATSSTVTVTGTSTTVDTSSATTGTTLSSAQVEGLPVNGRDVSSFLEIAPGSVDSTGTFQGSVNGLENIFTGLNIKLDGQNASRGDINGFLDTEGQEQARVTRASIDSIQEIEFANNGYSAENGFSLGPQMNIITKSGTDLFHGGIFEYFRNDALDAKDYFENPVTLPTAPLRLNQFGGNVGGPIIRNKVFFFVNYEGVRQRVTALNSLYEIPSAYVRSLFVPSMQPVLAQFAPLPATCTSIPAPASCAVPDTVDPANPAGGAQLIYDPAALPTSLREDTGSVRIDYDITQNDRINFRYNINDSLTSQEYGLNQGQTTPQKLRTQLGKLDWTHTFNPTFLNEFAVSYNRFYSDTNSDTPTPLVGFSGFFTNLGALPGPNQFNQITPFNVFEVFDSATKTFGSHTLKFGTQMRVNRLNEWLRPQQTFDFASFHDLENNAPFVLAKIGFPGFVGMRNSNFDFYVQDDWKVTRTLTLNLGLRYEYNTVWREEHDQIQNFSVATQSFASPTAPPYSSPGNEFAPRVGFAWDPFGKGKTVIKGYGGIFYMPMQFGFNLTSNIPALASYNVNVFQVPIMYPMANPPLPAGTQNVTEFPTHPHDPYSTNWLFGVQQELFRDTVLSVNYTGNRTSHMQAGVSFAAPNANPANIVTQARQYSGFASESVDEDGLFSKYNALQVQFKHTTRRLTLEANYSWSHEIDDLVNVFSGFSNPFNPKDDIGSGDWDVRNNFTASALYNLPELKDQNSIVRGALGGWQTSSIIQVRSGLPVNVTLESGFFGIPIRPDFTGAPIKLSGPGTNWPNSPYNVGAFTIQPDFDGSWGDNLGDVGRNQLRGPAFAQVDWSLMKNFPIKERFTVQFRVDLFNLFNHPNFQGPDGGICTSVTPESTTGGVTTPASCVTNPNFGRIGQTIASANGSQVGTGTARQAQFSLRLSF